jgi:hypothetical protein
MRTALLTINTIAQALMLQIRRQTSERHRCQLSATAKLAMPLAAMAASTRTVKWRQQAALMAHIGPAIGSVLMPASAKTTFARTVRKGFNTALTAHDPAVHCNLAK